MSDLTREAIEERIADLTRQRDQYFASAQQQIAHYNGAIQALEALLTEEIEVQSAEPAKE
jgi:hypothetical protein